jgi:branched-chain amino acid transport system permease protein
VVSLALWAFVLGERGRALRSLAQDAERAAFVGIDVYRNRVLAFALSGGIAGLCGGLAAPWIQIVTPDMSHWSHSAQPMLNTLLGGAGVYWGPVVGAFAYSGLNYATRTFAGISELIIGVILLIVILIVPTGISGAFTVLRRLIPRAPTGPVPTPAPAEQRR